MTPHRSCTHTLLSPTPVACAQNLRGQRCSHESRAYRRSYTSPCQSYQPCSAGQRTNTHHKQEPARARVYDSFQAHVRGRVDAARPMGLQPENWHVTAPSCPASGGRGSPEICARPRAVSRSSGARRRWEGSSRRRPAGGCSAPCRRSPRRRPQMPAAVARPGGRTGES